jgi:ubiquinone/menaquinone biosynthesis C-methylase UbiE
MTQLQDELSKIYDRRLTADAAFRTEMWRLLCATFFQKYVAPTDRIVEFAAGHCEFINAIKALEKIAVDLNPDAQKWAAEDVQVVHSSVTSIPALTDRSCDVVFASNLFEHLTRPDIVATIREAHRILKMGGRLLILQPNIRFTAKDYWMFFDHITPLDDRSLTEALETNGFRVIQTIVRFLPYTTKTNVPKSLTLVRWYLRLPFIWRFFGGQSFLVAVPQF